MRYSCRSTQVSTAILELTRKKLFSLHPLKVPRNPGSQVHLCSITEQPQTLGCAFLPLATASPLQRHELPTTRCARLASSATFLISLVDCTLVSQSSIVTVSLKFCCWGCQAVKFVFKSSRQRRQVVDGYSRPSNSLPLAVFNPKRFPCSHNSSSVTCRVLAVQPVRSTRLVRTVI